MSKKVLIIDDNQELNDTLAMVVKSKKLEVETALNAKQGLEKVKSFRPDLVIVDIMMEEMDSGLKLAEALNDTFPDIPKFCMSNIADTTSMTIDLQHYKFKELIQKPVDPDDLVSKIKTELGMD
ncbi:MAG: response regulator [Spirochaetes bacterium]|nr:response regulator [Spirochaetota bacterium]